MAAELSIGIIDSGFAVQQGAQVAQSRRFSMEADELHEGVVQPDALGHGSVVLQTLSKEAGAVRLCVAQVFGDRWQTSSLQVAAALGWLVEQGVVLVNMSLGLRTDRPLLREACEQAQARGVLLCASSPAQGEPIFPASYPGVIRVTGDARCAPGQLSWLNSRQADFGAHVAAANGVAGSSFACAALSGQIVNYLQTNPGAEREAVLAWLRARAAFIGVERRG